MEGGVSIGDDKIRRWREGLPVSRNGRQPSRAGNRGLDIGATPYFSAAVLIAAPTLWECQSDCALL